MKLAGQRASAFCARPDEIRAGRVSGVLLHGPDAALLGLRRRELVAALTEGDDLRLTRIDPAAAAKDPAGIDAALRARGFFPGRRVVLIEAAKDSLAGSLRKVLEDLGPGGLDADEIVLVVTAEGLAARSGLRRLFEAGAGLAALGLYPDPPGAGELAAMLAAAGLRAGLTAEASEALSAAAVQVDRGALAQLIETVTVYALDRNQPLGLEALAPLLPAGRETELDRLSALVAEGQAAGIGPMIGRLAAAGTRPVAMLIAVSRHFRQLLALAAAPDGIEGGLRRLRPPAFGARRAALGDQAQNWAGPRVEAASRLLFETNRTLRSAGERPDQALVERCLIRVAMMVARQP